MKKSNRYFELVVGLCVIVLFLGVSITTAQAQSNIPTSLESFDALDDTVWERVSTAGFGNADNFSVVAMAEYQGRLYAMTRNQSAGAEVWRTNGSGWEQVLFSNGETNGIYGNPKINNVWGRMIVFNNKLYFGFSSGLQGNYLGSTGCEIWRYDGTTWEPVISDKRAVEDTGSLTSITDSADDDGTSYGYFYDTGKAWTIDQWVGGVLTITSGTGQYRKFRIIANTETRLTVQQNETAGTYTDGVNEGEFTVSAEKTFVNMFPRYDYTLGAVNTGDNYEINTGWEQNGFGDMWNKTITAMVVFNDTLYVSTGLNYESGAQVWFTADGDTWEVTESSITATEPYTYNSFGNFHSSQPGYLGSLKPVSSSITSLVVSSVAGTPVLYAGGTGTTGSSGGCARLAQLTAGGWQMIVDNNVDTNTDGSNENGFGSPSSCSTNEFNFMPWGLTDFMGELLVAISGEGARVLRAPALTDAQSMLDDGRWIYSVGQGNVEDGYTDPLGSSIYPNGFDGYAFSDGTYQNIASNLFPFGNSLFGGTISFYVPEWNIPADMNELLGAQLWRSPNGMTWTQVTDDGFGDSDTIMFEAFAEFNGILYVSGSKGASSTPSGLGGANIYRMAYEPCVTTVEDQGLADKFERFTVTGITTEVPGDDPNPEGFLGAAFLRAGDLDGDGAQEIVVTSGTGLSGSYWSQDSAVAVFKRTSDDLSTWVQSVICSDFAFANDMVIRDVDGDGEVDIMVFDNFLAGQYTNQPAGIYLLKNLGGDVTDALNWQKVTLYSEDPNEASDAYEKAKRRASYHQAYFVDLDGDGHEDFATTRVSMEIWQAREATQPDLYGEQYMWVEWFRAETDLVTYPTGFSGPYLIGDGAGFLMGMEDIDDDGLLDILGPQFFITEPGTVTIKGSPDGSDLYGDSLVWFKNPGTAALAAQAADLNPDQEMYSWERYTIDNWYTSLNPLGKAFGAFPADITNDGINEVILTTHNHQDGINNQRIWPSGVYYLEIPEDPYDSANWAPVAIDAGDAYLVDRPGGPFSQGSPGFAAVGDITGNGLNDLVVAGDGHGGSYYYEAVAAEGCSLKFKRVVLYEDPGCMPAEIKLYDIDGDGELEILGTVYDTSLAKDSSSGSVFIWKLNASPTIGDGPFLAAGSWPVLPTDPDNPMILTQDYSVLWTFSDDYLTCSDPAPELVYTAEYQADGDSSWTELDVDADLISDWYAGFELPVEQLQSATYAVRFTVTDCAEQETISSLYYFRVDTPPVIGDGPFIAAGSWPVLPTNASQAQAFVLNQDYDVLWTFSDDYASCPDGACTHRARYKNVDSADWTRLTVSTDSKWMGFPYATLPIVSSDLAAGMYMFQFDVTDCASQYTYPPSYYYFKVEE